MHPFDRITEAELRRRQSAKWRHYPPDVLPAWIAEMDVPLAAPITEALERAIGESDCGYPNATGLGEAFVSWANRHYGWEPDPRDVKLAPDVVTAIAELLRVTTEPGDSVLIEPPVYPVFASTIRELGRVVQEAPLLHEGSSYAFDLEATERAYRTGTKVHLMCSPHNPSGFVPSTETLARIADLADAHGVLVLSDEIHAPMVFPGKVHVPFLSVSDAARRCGIVLTGAAKAFNLAGLKAALIIASGDAPRGAIGKLSPNFFYHAGHFGVLAARAAFEAGDEWLASLIAFLDRNRRLLADLLASSLPEVHYEPPQAGYLTWLDCRDLADRITRVGGTPADPARTFLERGRVALSPGPTFGTGGSGFVRLNIATPAPLLEEAVRRMRRALD